jgi:hypothetical protein
LFEEFSANPADAQAVGVEALEYWRQYNWRTTPLKHPPWGNGRLRLWLEVEATQVYGKLPMRERKVFFAWWRWKRGIRRKVKRAYDGTVFYTDELGRIRVFTPRCRLRALGA